MYINLLNNQPLPSKREEPGESPSLQRKHSPETLFSWQAPEFETFQREKRWYLWVALILLAIIGYATYTNSPVMAITFILIGVVGYIYLNKEPRVLDFQITAKGIIAGKDLYDFESIDSFWIFENSTQLDILSLHIKNRFTSFVHIPFYEEHSPQIHSLLLEYIPEEKQELTLADSLEKFFHL
jgi:hypothetical protein